MDHGIRGLCALGLFLAGYVFYTSSLLEPYYSMEFTLSSLQTGMAQAAVPLGAMIGAICAGHLGDHFGRHRLLVWAFLLISGSGILSIFVCNFFTLYVFRFVNGALAGMLYPLCAAYLTEMTSETTLARHSAVLMFVNCLAAPVGCCVAMLLATFFSGDLLWRLIVMAQIFPALIAYYLIRQLPESQKWLSVKRDRGIAIQTLFHPGFRTLTACLAGTWFLMDIAYYGINFFIPFLLKIMAVENGTFIISLFFSFSAGVAIFIVDHVNLYKLQKYGLLLASLSLFLLTLYFYFGLQQAFIIIALFILFNFALNVGPDVTTYLLSATSYPVEMRASSHGMIAGVAKLGSVIGVLLLPVLQNIFGVQFVLVLLACVLFSAYILSEIFEKIMLKETYLREESDYIYETH